MSCKNILISPPPNGMELVFVHDVKACILNLYKNAGYFIYIYIFTLADLKYRIHNAYCKHKCVWIFN